MKIKILIITSLFVLTSCNYRVDKGSGEVAAPDTTFSLVGNQITYQMVLTKVLAKNCLDCHSEKGGNRAGLNLENYQNVFEARDFIRSEILSKRMPKSPAARTSNPVKLVTFANLSENISMIKDDITTNRMPLRGILTVSQKKLILEWIDAGAPKT